MLHRSTKTIPQDIKGNWKKLGSGSFGNVFKGKTSILDMNAIADVGLGTYLGIDVAIKEVLPSNEYDVGKYFEREWRLMKCAIALYLHPISPYCFTESVGIPT